jgi:hypothetical protein
MIRSLTLVLVLAGAVAGGLWPSLGRASMDEGKTVRGDFNGDGVLETVASEPSGSAGRHRAPTGLPRDRLAVWRLRRPACASGYEHDWLDRGVDD